MATNNNRKIQLYLSTGTRDGSSSWRHNFSRILDTQTNRGEGLTQMFSSFDTSSMDADSSIDLLMLANPKSPATNNAYSSLVKTLLTSLNNSKALKTIGSIAELGINVVSVYNDVVPSDIGESSRTARVFQPWTKNVSAFADSQGGITFEYEFKFNLGQYGLWNAKEEVVKPILNLVAPAFPQYVSDYTMAGPFPSTAELLYRMIVAETASDALDSVSDIKNNFTSIGEGITDEMSFLTKAKTTATDTLSAISDSLSTIGDFLANIVKDSYSQFSYTLEFGNIIQFKNMVIKQAKTSFSNEVDQNGFPISGSATLTFEGLVPQALTYNTGNFGTIKMFGYGED